MLEPQPNPETKPAPFAWKCSECGRPQSTGKAGFDDLKGLCYDCDEIQRYTPRREQVAEMAEVPACYRRGFVAPSAWPVDLASGASIDKWAGKPWAVTFAGESGAGKTTLATELLIRSVIASRRADGGLWTRASQLAAALDGPLREHWRNRANDAPVLLIDDLGREFSAGGTLRLVEILATRADWLRPTIVTTNLPVLGPKSLSALDAGLFRRLSAGWLAEMLGAWKS